MSHHHPIDSSQPVANDSNGLNQPFNQNPFADLFRPPTGGPSSFEGQGRPGHEMMPREHGLGPHHHSHHHHHLLAGENGAPHESAHHHLPNFSIEDGSKHHHGRHHGRASEAEPGAERQPETGPGSWGRTGSSSEAIAQAAENSVGHHTYLPRHGSQFYGEHISAGLGCTSASTNMFFDGLKNAGKVSDADYRRLHQIGNDAAYVNLQHQGVAKPVSANHLAPGDWVYFKNPGHLHGHSGVIFQDRNGEMMVANNHSGTTIATPLSQMMEKYRRGSVRGLRADL